MDDLAIELRSAKGWRGTDAYIGESDFFWYTTTSNWQSEYVFYALINGRTNRAASEMYHDELYISVRCVKDY